MKRSQICAALCVLLSVSLWSCQKTEKNDPALEQEQKSVEQALNKKDDPAATSTPKPKPIEIEKTMLAVFYPLPKVFDSKVNPITEEKVALGRMLYYDKRLSKNHDVSCNSCHNLETFGVDNKKVSEGHKKQLGERNSPSVYNAAGHFVQFWDGRSPHVEHQATQPLQNPVEMAMTKKQILRVLYSIPEYRKAFKKVFPKSRRPTLENLGKAIGAFERKLVTHSRWDKFLKGEKTALTDTEKKGFLTFVKTGCVTCHMGPLVGGGLYQKLGLLKPWPTKSKDLGRFQVTKSDAEKMLFKVPSLRNVEKTAPYLHDGSIESLEKVVEMMALYQLNKTLAKEQIDLIVAWLKTLTGEIPTELIKKPVLPKSTRRTPKPNPA